MDMQPLTGACFSVFANVVFIFNRTKQTPFCGDCQKDFFVLKISPFQGLSAGRAVVN